MLQQCCNQYYLNICVLLADKIVQYGIGKNILLSVLKSFAFEILRGKLKITKVGSNIALNITSRQAGTRPKASPHHLILGREHILYSALHRDITFSHLFLSTYILVPFLLQFCTFPFKIHFDNFVSKISTHTPYLIDTFNTKMINSNI